MRNGLAFLAIGSTIAVYCHQGIALADAAPENTVISLFVDGCDIKATPSLSSWRTDSGTRCEEREPEGIHIGENGYLKVNLSGAIPSQDFRITTTLKLLELKYIQSIVARHIYPDGPCKGKNSFSYGLFEGNPFFSSFWPSDGECKQFAGVFEGTPLAVGQWHNLTLSYDHRARTMTMKRGPDDAGFIAGAPPNWRVNPLADGEFFIGGFPKPDGATEYGLRGILHSVAVLTKGQPVKEFAGDSWGTVAPPAPSPTAAAVPQPSSGSLRHKSLSEILATADRSELRRYLAEVQPPAAEILRYKEAVLRALDPRLDSSRYSDVEDFRLILERLPPQAFEDWFTYEQYSFHDQLRFDPSQYGFGAETLEEKFKNWLSVRFRGKSDLHKAAADLDINGIRRALALGDDIDLAEDTIDNIGMTIGDHWTALGIAAMADPARRRCESPEGLRTIAYLIASGADLDVPILKSRGLRVTKRTSVREFIPLVFDPASTFNWSPCGAGGKHRTIRSLFTDPALLTRNREGRLEWERANLTGRTLLEQRRAFLAAPLYRHLGTFDGAYRAFLGTFAREDFVAAQKLARSKEDKAKLEYMAALVSHPSNSLSLQLQERDSNTTWSNSSFEFIGRSVSASGKRQVVVMATPVKAKKAAVNLSTPYDIKVRFTVTRVGHTEGENGDSEYIVDKDVWIPFDPKRPGKTSVDMGEFVTYSKTEGRGLFGVNSEYKMNTLKIEYKIIGMKPR